MRVHLLLPSHVPRLGKSTRPLSSPRALSREPQEGGTTFQELLVGGRMGQIEGETAKFLDLVLRLLVFTDKGGSVRTVGGILMKVVPCCRRLFRMLDTLGLFGRATPLGGGRTRGQVDHGYDGIDIVVSRRLGGRGNRRGRRQGDGRRSLLGRLGSAAATFLRRQRGSPRRPPFQSENVIQRNHTLVNIGRLSLSPLAQPDKAKVIQLASERGKGGVVKIAGQDGGFDTDAIVHHQTAQDPFSVATICGSRCNSRAQKRANKRGVSGQVPVVGVRGIPRIPLRVLTSGQKGYYPFILFQHILQAPGRVRDEEQ
jgi:hypothetical protein